MQFRLITSEYVELERVNTVSSVVHSVSKTIETILKSLESGVDCKCGG